MNSSIPRILAMHETIKTSPVQIRLQTRELMDRAFASLGFDMFATFGALALAQYLSERMGSVSTESPVLSLPFVALTLVAWLVSFLAWSVYPDERQQGLSTLLPRVVLAVFSAWMLMCTVASFAQIALPQPFLLLFLGLNLIAVISWRLIGRYVVHSPLVQKMPRRTLLIGSHELGMRFAEQSTEDPKSLFKVCGLITDEIAESGSIYPVLGSMQSNLESIIEQNEIEATVMVLSNESIPALQRIYEQLSLLPVQVYGIPESMEKKHLTLNSSLLERFQLFAAMPSTMSMRERMVKRMIDIMLSSFALLLILPMFLMIAVAIKLDSPGPIFFKQLRVGEYRRRFHMFKFRSMVQNAEKIQTQVNVVDASGNILHKSKHDPRVTRVGRIIRKTSIDELPQLINVLLGDMSLVGPRPELPWVVNNYEEWQNQRFVVPPGITGWWQINGRSDEKPMHLCTEDDLYYIQNYSLLLDVKIILFTVPVVLSGKGSF